MTTQDYYTWNVGLVLDNNSGFYDLVNSWIKDELTDQDKDMAIALLAEWLQDLIEDEIYDTLDKMGKGLGAQLIREVVDFGQVDWMDIDEGYLEDYKPESEDEVE